MPYYVNPLLKCWLRPAPNVPKARNDLQGIGSPRFTLPIPAGISEPSIGVLRECLVNGVLAGPPTAAKPEVASSVWTAKTRSAASWPGPGRDCWRNRQLMACLIVLVREMAIAVANVTQGDNVEILPQQRSSKGPADKFTGDVWFDVIAAGPPPSRLRVNAVHFSPGARTAWHCHANGQTLRVTEGVGLVQSRGGDVIEIHPGDTIVTPPGQWHWHGATAERFMTHLAMWESLGEGQQGPETTWGEPVSEEQYRA